jgi:tetratricopeptide (TPR) repeat protein
MWLSSASLSMEWARADARPEATVVALNGAPVFRSAMRSTDGFRPLRVRTALYAGDVVDTRNGRVTILFLGDSSQAKLGERTRIRIAPPRTIKGKPSLFQVLAGRIWGLIRPGRGASTEYSNLVVRGTEVYLEVEGDTSSLTVLEGEVDFSSVLEGETLGTVLVQDRQRSTVVRGRPPTPPVTIDNNNPEFIVEWTWELNRVLFPREKLFVGLNPQALTSTLAQRAAAARSAPNDVAALQAYGDALFDAHRFREALVQYQAAQKLSLANAGLLIRLGYTLLELDELDEAQASFKNVLATSRTKNAAEAAQPVPASLSTSTRAKDEAAVHQLGHTGDISSALRLVQTENTDYTAQALSGLAWVALERNRAQEALLLAREAVAADGQAIEAQLVLVQALLAQPEATENTSEARDILQRVLATPAPGLRHLAHVALSSLLLFQNDAPGALAEARRAVETNSYSVAAQLALGQALLANRQVNNAASAAQRAIALNPESAPARYLLAITQAQQRQYGNAAEQLELALRSDPTFTPAVGVLGRVYARMGHNLKAVNLLRAADVLNTAQFQDNDPYAISTALGEAYYLVGRYKESLEEYRRATRRQPESAAAQAGLARVAIDANQLNEAIRAGQRAVQLAPNVGQYHAILGLAYTFSRLDAQAERAYRTALSLDSQNALALVQLSRLNREGDIRVTSRTQAIAFVQGFIIDPGISRDLLRGGVNTEVQVRGGPDNQGGFLRHRETSDDGKLRFFGEVLHAQDDGDRANADQTRTTGRIDPTYVLDENTTLYVHALKQDNEFGVPGTRTNPARDDRAEFDLSEGVVAARRQIGARNSFWAGIFATNQNEERTNPGRDLSFTFQDLLVIPSVTKRQTTSRVFSPEFRFDRVLGSQQNPGTFSLGFARSHTETSAYNRLFAPSLPDFPDLRGSVRIRQRADVSLWYTQISTQLGQRASFIGQLRYQTVPLATVARGQFLATRFTDPEKLTSKSYLLPSMVLNYQAGKRTLLRLSASRRVTDISSSVFAPVATLLTTEAQVLPNGLPNPGRGDLYTTQLDLERYVSKGGLLKFFVFGTRARNLTYDFSGFANPSNFNDTPPTYPTSLTLKDVERVGAGARFEQQLSRSLFGFATVAFNRTTSRDTLLLLPGFKTLVAAPFNGEIAPYHPRVAAQVGLNYLDRRGNKARLFANYTGAFFADTADPTLLARPRSPARVTFDLFLSREPSVRQEIFVQVTNLFNASQIIYNDVPLNGRRVTFGLTRRF